MEQGLLGHRLLILSETKMKVSTPNPYKLPLKLCQVNIYFSACILEMQPFFPIVCEKVQNSI